MPGTIQARSRRLIRHGWLAGMAGAIALLAGSAGAAEVPRLAVAGFSFKDTSGEVRDQTAEHAARLKAFDAVLNGDLAASPDIDPVALPCEAGQCGDLGALAAQAKAASARFLLVGEVHKMSTLVGWVKFAVLDVDGNKPVCDRHLTYRGDTDEAWRRAAAFTARDVQKHCIP
jgi:Protein of unknown function (DUF2380)